MKPRVQKIFFFVICALIGTMAAGPLNRDAGANQAPSDRQPFEGFVYFADARGTYLKSVKTMFPSPPNDHVLAGQIIDSMIRGPVSGDLTATWPKTAAMNAFFIADDQTAYVDMQIEPEMTDHMDCRDETLAVYALVNSLTVNIPKIKKVKILINGRDAATLAGHVNLEYLYKTNMLIVK